ncbi:MAG: response regulator [Chloroflexi bacterium]|nr:response regulator [Chloroflexota bacterium]MBU1746854.1 response regulator [Chloroflexota bacterium]
MTQPKPRLLVVDDEPTVLFLLGRLLSQQYDVTTCPDGQTALHWLNTAPFDLIITDLRLPDVTGLDILSAARALPDASRPAVIIITGYASMDSAVQATNDGASAYVLKPIEPAYFLGTISRTLETRQLAHDLRESEQRYRRLYGQAEQRVQELQLLFEASQLLGHSLDTDGLGQRVTHILEDLFPVPHQRAEILLFDDLDSPVQTELLTACAAAATTTQTQWFHIATTCQPDCAVRRGQPQPWTRQVGDDHADCPSCSPETQSLLCIPLQTDGQVIGALCCQSAQAEAFHPDQRWLFTLAGQLAAVLDSLRMIQQRERLAALEERVHMARVLHDGLAQRLGYLGLALDGLLPLLDAGRLDDVRADLVRMRDVVDQGHHEIRTTIRGLRQATDASTLRTELAVFVRRWSREHQIVAQFSYTLPQQVQLSPHQARHVLGLVREALTNVAKHAHATQVQITVEPRAADCILTIVDDGVGFDPARVPAAETHLGRVIMEESAALLGGRLVLDSRPGQGTRIQVIWPASVLAIEQ